jgi:hypothetical protein
MKQQWHPIFARLLRPLVESHYDIRTNVPVGDVPREADVLLLRRVWKEVEAMAKRKRKEFDFQLEPLFEAVGIERVIETVGLDRVIATFGIVRIVKEKGVEWLLAQMSPQQRRELKEQLK